MAWALNALGIDIPEQGSSFHFFAHAFRRASLHTHPDKNPPSNVFPSFHEVQYAFAHLTDPKTRTVLTERLSAAIRDAKLTGYRRTFFPELKIGDPSVFGPYSDNHKPTNGPPNFFDLSLWLIHSEFQEEEDWEGGSITSSMQQDVNSDGPSRPMSPVDAIGSGGDEGGILTNGVMETEIEGRIVTTTGSE
ncbi:hypothetical protein B0T14DRAFT_493337 [Immersiella caudata]|uniref:J domain-containing protein n=1 Tax=Immersiella caudata TaxID=314043 RepID=A0AA39X4J1_9PEZI|nr:hypothetical protein B0T14DRAFT_493337 [Immersiella caudata]